MSLAGVLDGDRCFCGTAADLATTAAKARAIANKKACETVPCKGEPAREGGCGGVDTMLVYSFSCDAAADKAAQQVRQPQQGIGGTTLIDTNKTCFSCFRIPTFLAGQTPGVIHAFAEGRRAGLQTSGANVYHCPDGPDTRLVYGNFNIILEPHDFKLHDTLHARRAVIYSVPMLIVC